MTIGFVKPALFAAALLAALPYLPSAAWARGTRAGRSLHSLMYGLLYPAVLGAAFVLFISVDIASFFRQPLVHPRLLFGLVFLFHWSMEFMTEWLPDARGDYSAFHFMSDLFVLIAINAAIFSLPAPPAIAASYANFYIAVGMIGLVFSITDIVFYRLGIRTDAPWISILFWVDVGLAFAGALFWTAHQLSSAVDHSARIATLFVVVTLVASILSWVGRRDRLVDLGFIYPKPARPLRGIGKSCGTPTHRPRKQAPLRLPRRRMIAKREEGELINRKAG